MKKIQILLALLLSSVSLFAEPIGEQRARQIAEEFFAQHDTRATTGEIALTWAGDVFGEASASGSMLNTSLMYIYSRGETGGFVIVSGDSNTESIIAYSLEHPFDINNMADATETILDAWCREIGQARKEARPISGTERAAQTRANDAIKYETAQWNQSEPFNWESPIYDGDRSVTGCVATAMSIICKYHKWPTKGVGTTPEYSYQDAYGVYRSVAANKLGRTYNYSNMLMDYNSGYTTTQGNAVAALMKDMGTSVKMQYHHSGSAAYDMDVITAFSTYFGYSKDIELAMHSSYNDADWQSLVRENLRNYGPTYFCGQSANGGHAFIVDGFDAEGRFSFNFGWGGYGNGYFYMPSIEYYADQKAILRLTPDRDGTSTYNDNLMLYALYSGDEQVFYGIRSFATSYKVNEPFACKLGGFINYGSVEFNGDIKLVLCDKDGTWKEELYTGSFSLTPNMIYYYPYNITITITQPLEVGDRLRIYYKGTYSDDWKWMRSSNLSIVDQELLVMASPEDIAKGLEFTYDKEGKYMTIYSDNAAHVEICDGDTGVSLATDDIAARGGVSYEYTSSHKTLVLKISLGSEPYILTIKL